MMKKFFLLLLFIFLCGCNSKNDPRQPVWKMTLKARVYADVIAEKEVFYAFTQAGEVVAGSIKTGKEIWKRTLSDAILGTPAVSSDSIFLATYQGGVARLRKKDGATEWEKQWDDSFIGPVVMMDSLILIPSETGTLYAFNPANGTEQWKLTGQKKFNTRPVISGNRIFIGGWEKLLFCLKKDGSVEWKFQASDIISEDAAVLKNLVFFAAYDHFVYALEAQTGKLVWRHPAVRPSNLVLLRNDKSNESSPAIELVFASGNDLVYLSPESGNVIRVVKFGKIISRLYAENSDLYVVSSDVYRIKSGDAIPLIVINSPNPVFKLTFAAGMTLALDDLYSIYGYAPVQE
jgi:outer membrane protein assembly factor BamB